VKGCGNILSGMVQYIRFIETKGSYDMYMKGPLRAACGMNLKNYTKSLFFCVLVGKRKSKLHRGNRF
jgi:hypothetical protein